MKCCVACHQLIAFGAIRRDDKCFCSHACMSTVYEIGFTKFAWTKPTNAVQKAFLNPAGAE